MATGARSRRARRNVVQEDAPEEVPAQAPLPQLFISPEIEQNFHTDYALRAIVEGKQFNVELFSSHGINIVPLFRRQGLIHFLSIKENVYPRLLRLFYANLHHPLLDNGRVNRLRLATLINGQMISFTETDLSRIFRFPIENVTVVPSNFGNLFGFNKHAAQHLLFKRRYRTTGNEPKASMLKLPNRLIHSIVGYSIVPRRGSRASVNALDLFLVWAINMGHKIDFGSLMFHHLVEITNRKKQGLVYGMALTRLFQHFNVQLNDETEVIAPTNEEVYSSKTIRLMKYGLENGVWVANDPRDRDDEDDEHDDEDEDDETEVEPMDEEEPEIPQEASSSRGTRRSRAAREDPRHTAMLNAIQGVSAQVQGMHIQINNRFDRLEDRQRAHEAAFLHYHPDHVFPAWTPWPQDQGWGQWPQEDPQ